MKANCYSYRYAREILQHVNYRKAWDEIDQIVRAAPIFTYQGKSSKNPRLDIVQQLINAYFDRMFVIEKGWTFHPLATGIQSSQLTADYRKEFTGRDNKTISVQVEVQLGNMSRWYTDVFKFQTAYSQKLIQVGLCIIPMLNLAQRIDSNIVNYERVGRELPYADLSITLPIVILGVEVDHETPIVDVSECRLGGLKQIIGKGKQDNRRRIIQAHLSGQPMRSVTSESDLGPEMPVVADEDESQE